MLFKGIVIAAITILLSLRAEAEVFQNWETRCANDVCRTFTVAWMTVYQGEPPTLVVLEVSPKEVLISALDTEEVHYKRSRITLPVELLHQGENFVASRTFFNKHGGPSISVDGKNVAIFRVLDDSHLVASSGETSVLVAEFRRGSKAGLSYYSPLRGKGQRVSFSLIGFTAAYAARSASNEAVVAAPTMNPISVVAPMLAGNRFRIGTERLRSLKNPYGEGAFVYVPELKIAGYKRLFIWFVKQDTVIKLNGATHSLTPSLLYPQEARYQLWRGTGLSVEDVTSKGIELIFGQ